jgi:LPXTG-site transpeptidase (sortase) family protein
VSGQREPPAGGRGPVPRGTVYRSQHAVPSLLRSETGTTGRDTTGTDPVAAPAPNDAAVDERVRRSATSDPAAVPAAPEAVPPAQTGPSVRRLRRALLPVVAAVVTGFVVGTGYLAVSEPRPTGEVGRWGGAAPVTAGVPDTADPARGRPDPLGPATPEPHGVPTRLRVGTIGVDTPLETLRIGRTGRLDPPKDFARAGWYADGTVPGDLGPAVIAGHVDNRHGPAVFYRLRELEAGDRIEVVRGGETVRFTVTSTAWYPKTAFPTAAVYGPTPDRQLRLITCGGVFDHRLRSYRDNLVVYAVAG